MGETHKLNNPTLALNRVGCILRCSLLKGNSPITMRKQEWNSTFSCDKWEERARGKSCRYFGTQGHTPPGPATQSSLAEGGFPSILLLTTVSEFIYLVQVHLHQWHFKNGFLSKNISFLRQFLLCSPVWPWTHVFLPQHPKGIFVGMDCPSTDTWWSVREFAEIWGTFSRIYSL